MRSEKGKLSGRISIHRELEEGERDLTMSFKRCENYGLGKSIRLRGIAPDNGNFVVNIFSGSNPNDLLFHFNPRFNENCVVRNSRLGGSWGPEERQGKLGFKQNKRFNILITAQADCFLVMVNDEEFCRYRYRCALPRTVLVELDCGIDYF